MIFIEWTDVEIGQILLRFSRISVYVLILLIFGIFWFVPWYPPTGTSEIYSKRDVYLEPNTTPPKQLDIIFLPAGTTITAKVSACQECSIGIWSPSGVFVLLTVGSSSSEFEVSNSGSYLLVGQNYDVEPQHVDISLTVARTSPFAIIARFGLMMIVLFFPFAFSIGMLFELSLVTKMLHSISDTSIIPGSSSGDVGLNDLLLKVHEFWDAGKKVEKWFNLLFVDLYVLVGISVTFGGIFVYYATTAAGTPSVAWNNPATQPLAVVFLLMFIIGALSLAPIVVLARFNMKWDKRFKGLREAVKATMEGSRSGETRTHS